MTTYIVVRRGPGPGWLRDGPLRSQPLWPEHAAFMNALVEEGFVVLGGPIGDEEENEALIVFDAPSEAVVRDRLSQDPWTPAQTLLIRSVELWTILLENRPQG